jgi:hypothetical protein
MTIRGGADSDERQSLPSLRVLQIVKGIGK